MNTRLTGLLPSVAALLGSAPMPPDATSQQQPHGHRSSTGSHSRTTGRDAKRAEKRRRRLTRRAK